MGETIRVVTPEGTVAGTGVVGGVKLEGASCMIVVILSQLGRGSVVPVLLLNLLQG